MVFSYANWNCHTFLGGRNGGKNVAKSKLTAHINNSSSEHDERTLRHLPCMAVDQSIMNKVPI